MAACDGEGSEQNAPDFIDACVRYTEQTSECAGVEAPDAETLAGLCESIKEVSEGAGCLDLTATFFDCIANTACSGLAEGACSEQEQDYVDGCS